MGTGTRPPGAVARRPALKWKEKAEEHGSFMKAL
eukprot:gene26313-biopygen15769